MRAKYMGLGILLRQKSGKIGANFCPLGPFEGDRRKWGSLSLEKTSPRREQSVFQGETDHIKKISKRLLP